MKDFKELRVWKMGHELTLCVYDMTRTFPKEEIYGLTSQIRRSAASIGANIAEGCGRRSDREMVRFLQIARGSASETEYHLLLARDLGFLSPENYRNAVQKLSGETSSCQQPAASSQERADRRQLLPSSHSC